MSKRLPLLLALAALSGRTALAAPPAADTPSGPFAATIDLMTDAGAKLAKAEWRYSDTRIVEADFRAPGEDNQPTGAPIKTYDYTPHPGPSPTARSSST
jgi:hypothetical protein